MKNVCIGVCSSVVTPQSLGFYMLVRNDWTVYNLFALYVRLTTGLG